MVLCCICGVQISGPSQGARCAACLQKEVDITDGITRRAHVQQCGTCGRWLRPGGNSNTWVSAEMESRELLAVCLKHIKGLAKERQLVNAGFLWTEPHSKELKVKLELQQEVISGMVVRQTMAVEFRIDSFQCSDCKKMFTRHTWESNVQVRQRTGHRRTLLNLEQLIIKHKAHTQLIKVQTTKEGMDFFFSKEKDAQAFVAFVKTCAVVKHSESKHLVSQNLQNSTYRFKRTTCVELCPVCREDLVRLPPKLAQALGGLPPLMLCTRAASMVALLDPASGRALDVSPVDYWKRPFLPILSQPQLTEFVVLDVTPLDHNFGAEVARGAGRTTMVWCDIEIARVADFGVNDERITVRSHLGHVLHVSDIALGYDVRTANVGLDEDELSKVPQEVYLVKKQKAEKHQKRQGGKRQQRRRQQRPTAAVHGDPEEAPEGDTQEAPEGDADETEQAAGVGEGDLDDEDEDALEFREAAAKMLDAMGQTAPQEGDEAEEGQDTDAAAIVVGGDDVVEVAVAESGRDEAALGDEAAAPERSSPDLRLGFSDDEEPTRRGARKQRGKKR
mmetsp:Transcript_105548/g.305306  ORF Transcript_105548/g.305306 Transcript_105548/m.305306 type:complete len:561 (+) Transcript_105548:67-1749(+)